MIPRLSSNPLYKKISRGQGMVDAICPESDNVSTPRLASKKGQALNENTVACGNRWRHGSIGHVKWADESAKTKHNVRADNERGNKRQRNQHLAASAHLSLRRWLIGFPIHGGSIGLISAPVHYKLMGILS